MVSSYKRSCPLCGSSADQTTYLLGNFDPKRLTQFSFASRKEPEFMCHTLKQCHLCDLVFVEQPPPEADLAFAYHTADYDSSDEANDAALAYINALRPLISTLSLRLEALEIGTGSGIFLEQLLHEGFSRVVGVEPSEAAFVAAPESRRALIRHAMFRESDFSANSFDLICCFMTMEHVREPMELARSAIKLLRPGGAFVTITHDYRNIVNQLLGRRSPIIDIEHMQLFSPRSIDVLYQRSGYQAVTVRPFANKYAFSYWLRLTPLPVVLKRTVAYVAKALSFDTVKLEFNVGNQIAIGFRPR